MLHAIDFSVQARNSYLNKFLFKYKLFCYKYIPQLPVVLNNPDYTEFRTLLNILN